MEAIFKIMISFEESAEPFESLGITFFLSD